jgi:hypothetical protein
LTPALLIEIRARPDSPIWRKDRAAGLDFSLKLTVAGLKAIGAMETPGVGAEPAATAFDDLETEDRNYASGSKTDAQVANCSQPNF